jgi:hypothetical protein
MKLTYRGVPYEYTPVPVTAMQTGLVGKYRGVPFALQTITAPTIPEPECDLTYRGVHYHRGRASTLTVARATIPEMAMAIVKEQIVLLKVRFHQPMQKH